MIARHDVNAAIGEIIDVTCYSRLKGLLMVTSYVLRFIKNCRTRRKVVRNGEISLDEIDEPMKSRIKQEQRSIISNERYVNQMKHFVGAY